MSSFEPLVSSDSNIHVAYSGKIFSIVTEEAINSKGQRLDMEYVVCDDVVRVYPVDSSDVLWLIKERRHGVVEPVVLRTVSGSLESGESPEEAARRELGEELGMTADAFEVFHTSTPMLKVRHTVHHVLAVGARKASGLYAPDAFEEIEAVPVALEAVDRLVWANNFREDIIAFGLLTLLRRMKD